MAEYDLLKENWVPVRRRDGRRNFLSPLDLPVAAHEANPATAIDCGRADLSAALREFVAGLYSTALVLPDIETWLERRDAPPTREELSQGLNRWGRASFAIDGDGPRFMQDLDPLTDAEELPIDTLLIDGPNEEMLRKNTDHFQHRGLFPAVSRAAVAAMLFAVQSWSPAGGRGGRTSIRGGGPLSTLVRLAPEKAEPNLWRDGIWPNLVPDLDGAARRSPHSPFPWMRETLVSDKGAIVPGEEINPFEIFFAMPRRLRLVFAPGEGRLCPITGLADPVMAQGFRRQSFGNNYPSETYRHPFTPYYRQKEGDPQRLPVRAKPAHGSYRSWSGLVLEESGKKAATREPAEIVSRIRHFAPEDARILIDLHGYEMAQAKAESWVEATMPTPRFVDEKTEAALFRLAKELVEGADQAGQILRVQVLSALHDDPKRARGDVSRIAEALWRATEPHFHRLISGLAAGDDMQLRREWLGELRREALRIFQRETAGLDPIGRRMDSLAKATYRLGTGLAGYGPEGAKLFQKLGLPPPERKQAASKRRAGDAEARA